MSKNRAIAGALGAGLVLSLAALVWSRHAWTAPEDPDALPPESQWQIVRGPGAPPAGLPQAIDLLAAMDLGRDAVGGTWGFLDSSLLSGCSPWARIEVPCLPPREYDLRLRLTRKRGAGSLGLGVVREGVQGMIMLDGLDSQRSWIARAGHLGADGNDTATSTRAMKWNKPTSILVSVRGGEIHVWVEGVQILSWKGPSSDLALPPEFAVPGTKALILGASNATFRIDEYTLIPVSGSPTMLRKT